MEPIFNDSLFQGNIGIIHDSNILKRSSELFFEMPKNQTIENSFFHFGLLFDSLHYSRNDKWNEIYKPIKMQYKSIVDSIEIVAAQLGKDINDQYDESEADKYDPYYWRIIKGTEYKRPDWAFYMFIGNLQGVFNGNRMTQDKLIQYLNLFPKAFFDQHGDRVSYIFNYFDERGFILSLNNEIKLTKYGHGIFDEELNLREK